MIGERIGELVGMITSQRVLDVEDGVPKIEAAVNANGIIKNIMVTFFITYWNILKLDAMLYGE